MDSEDRRRGLAIRNDMMSCDVNGLNLKCSSCSKVRGCRGGGQEAVPRRVLPGKRGESGFCGMLVAPLTPDGPTESLLLRGSRPSVGRTVCKSSKPNVLTRYRCPLL